MTETDSTTCLNGGAALARRRVYDVGSWPTTVAKAFGGAVVYGTMWSVAVLAVTLWASR